MDLAELAADYSSPSGPIHKANPLKSLKAIRSRSRIADTRRMKELGIRSDQAKAARFAAQGPKGPQPIAPRSAPPAPDMSMYRRSPTSRRTKFLYADYKSPPSAFVRHTSTY